MSTILRIKDEKRKAAGDWEVQIQRWSAKDRKYILSCNWYTALPVVECPELCHIDKVAAFESLREMVVWVTPNE